MTPTSPPPLLEAVALRCRSCGAPLPADSTGDVIRCVHCGTSQRIVDARAFVDQISLQINSFLRNAIPLNSGALVGGSAVDPVARHNLFVQGIRPALDSEYREMKFRCFDLLSHGQMALPFTVAGMSGPTGDPKQAFVFQAKVRAVTSLAVDTDSQEYLADIDAIATAYGHLLTNAGLLLNPGPDRYPFLARNCRGASDVLKSRARLQALYERLLGLSGLAEGTDALMRNDARQARDALKEAMPHLLNSRQIALQNFDQSVLIGGIDEDLSLARATMSLADILSTGAGGRDARVLGTLEVFLRTITSPAPGGYVSASSINVGRTENLLSLAAQMRKAQAGQGSVKVVRTPGNLALPYWVVEVPYSFQTGALWKARGVEVTDMMLVAATFPIALNSAAGADPSSSVTDVFAAREQTTWRARVAGRETAISGGGIVQQVASGAAALPLPGIPAVPPLSTQAEATDLVQSYLTWSKRRDTEIEQKLRLSLPRVVDLVYIPSAPGAPGYPATPCLGSLSPRFVGDPAALTALAFA